MLRFLADENFKGEITRGLLLACRTLLRALERDSISGKLWSVERGRLREYRPDRLAEEN